LIKSHYFHRKMDIKSSFKKLIKNRNGRYA